MIREIINFRIFLNVKEIYTDTKRVLTNLNIVTYYFRIYWGSRNGPYIPEPDPAFGLVVFCLSLPWSHVSLRVGEGWNLIIEERIDLSASTTRKMLNDAQGYFH